MPKDTVRIAQVGAFRRMSQEDSARLIATMVVILPIDKDFAMKEKVSDIINLSYGRDFLKEKKTYDLVILHSLLSPKMPALRSKSPRLLVSPSHTIKEWRRRLSSSGAKYISVCEGQPATFSGWELGEVPGYRILERDNKITIYARVC